MPNALFVTGLPIYPSLGQAANGLYTQWLGVCVLSGVLIITTTVDLYTGSMIL